MDTLDEFVRVKAPGPFWRELQRLREIETLVFVLLASLPSHPFDVSDHPEVRDESLDKLRELTGRKAVR